jgi:hypothetical protein
MIPVGHPATSRWLVLLLVTTIAATVAAAAPGGTGEASRRADRQPPLAETLLTTDHDEPVHDHPYGRSQPRPTLPQENADLDPIAATAGRLAAALLRALAEPPLTATPNADGTAAAEDPWRGAARELAGELLADGRLSALLREPAVTAALVQELRDLRCEVVAVDEQQPHSPQRPDSGGAAGTAAREALGVQH